jgi:SAM-dependent methyltransferase
MNSARQDEFKPPAVWRLTRMVAWSHRFVAEVLQPGDLALDLTAGTGRDTLFLFHCVGLKGQVIAFDIQREALARTESLLAGAGARVVFHHCQEGGSPLAPGIHLVHDSHRHVSRYVLDSPRAVIANLGFLPCGDPRMRTRSESTLEALHQSIELLAPGGRMVVTVYIGHPGGKEEAAAVEALASNLPARNWKVLKVQTVNRPEAPFLMVAEKQPGLPEHLPG